MQGSTVTETLKLCLNLAATCQSSSQLQSTHAAFIVRGYANFFFGPKLIASFIRLGDLSNASLLLDQTQTHTPIIHNNLIAAYMRRSKHEQALLCFSSLLNNRNGLRPDAFSLNFAILSCGFSGRFLLGRLLHGWVYRSGDFTSDTHVPTAVTRMYVKFGEAGNARKAFDEIPNPDLVQWNVIIDGFVKLALDNEARLLFDKMISAGCEPDVFCLATALKACASSGSIFKGKWIHEYIKRNDLKMDVFVSTALADMYMKCGLVNRAEEVFDEMPKRNVFTFAAMVSGYAAHGMAKEAIRCFERMQQDGVRPDGVVLLGVLTACRHTGLLQEGMKVLQEMQGKYGVAPRHEHYSCLVDLLCRAGRLNEAFEVIKTMPSKPLASVWGALLSGCRTQGNTELAEVAFEELMKLAGGNQDEEEAAFAQLSNVYLSAGRIGEANKIRRLIGEKGLKKMAAGCSFVEIAGVINKFVSGDSSHCCITHIRSILRLIFQKFRSVWPVEAV